MSEYQEFTGKTVEEALRNARDAFAVTSLDDLDFEILTPGSRGVLGMGAEPARIVAAPRSALGGSAPRREAAEAQPLPQVSREERGPRRDDRGRGPRDDRGRGRDDRGRGPREERGREAAPAAPRAPHREDRPPRREHGEARPGGFRPREERGGHERREEPRREHARGVAGLSAGEQAQVAAARALSVEREEVQAAEATPEALAAGQEILQTILGYLGYDVTVTIRTGETSKLDVTGEGAEKEALGALIGRKGERLSALQHLVNLLLSKRMGTWTRVLVDVEDYRGRRERQLREIALRAADRVDETGKMLQLEAMPALERRWIHLALRERSGVSTQSIGEEPNRRVVIIPRHD